MYSQHVRPVEALLARRNTDNDAAGSILIGTGSVGLSLMYWIIGFVVSLAGLAVYLELGSYFPSRSGAEVVYLEQAYPRPRYFFPVAYAVQSVILSFSSSNAIGKLISHALPCIIPGLTRPQCWHSTSSAWLGAPRLLGNRRVLLLLAILQPLFVSPLLLCGCEPRTDKDKSGCLQQ